MGGKGKRKKLANRTQVEDAHDVNTATEGASPLHSVSSESEYEGLYIVSEVGMSNLPINIKPNQVKSFFEPIGGVGEVKIFPDIFDDGNGGKMRQGSVEIKSPSEKKKAMKLDGDLLLGRRIDLGRVRNGRRAYFISGYDKDLSLDDIKQQIRNHFGDCGTIWKFFFPKNSDNGSYLGFCYILLKLDKTNADVEKLDYSYMEGFEIRVRNATLKTRVLRAEMG